MKKILAILFIVFLYNSNVYAASICDYKEQTAINQKASNVKVSYEVVTETVKFEDMDSTMEAFDISIFNITEEFYVIVKNSVTEEEKYFTSADAVDGVIHFKWTYADNVTNFTIQVFTTNKTSCPDEKYKTVYLTTPRFNTYYNVETCQDNPDFYLCQKFVTFSEIDEEKFFKQLESYKNGEINSSGEDPKADTNDKITDKIFEFLDDYKWYMLGGLVIITGTTIVIQRIRTKKQRELGL